MPKIPAWVVKSIIHGAEALVVFGLAICIAYFFPEHKTEAIGLAIGILSTLAKGARAMPSDVVPDYVNKPPQLGQ